jgi:hypothetical protein
MITTMGSRTRYPADTHNFICVQGARENNVRAAGSGGPSGPYNQAACRCTALLAQLSRQRFQRIGAPGDEPHLVPFACI